MGLLFQSSAVISPCGKYRYRLSRVWDGRALPLVWIMLNPSTADAEADDPTIRRCASFAEREGAGGIEVLNLFALRATNPKELLSTPDPVGPDNDGWIREVLHPHGRAVAAWGAFPSTWERAAAVIDLARGVELVCLGRTAAGHPKHPLYVPSSQPLMRWAT